MEKIFEIHNNIIKYKGYEFQIVKDKYIQIGLRLVKIPEPYLLGRNKKWRVDIQFGIHPETGKRIRKAFFLVSIKRQKKMLLNLF